MPKEPPALRLVESQLGNGLDRTVTDLSAISEPPPLRLVERDDRGLRNGNGRPVGAAGAMGARRSAGSNTSTTLTALDRSTSPPVGRSAVAITSSR